MEGNDNHQTSGGWATPVYDELRRLARSFLRREPCGFRLQPEIFPFRAV